MEIYLVGGAVRDQLLGLPVKDRDWVVVGATPEQMVKAGYRPVGKDFPVFLHPQTHEEYALARTERKSGKGYRGFTFHTAPDVTLEQDLIRRDLSINAMAMDETGALIDPYGGQTDLENRLLRHVSDAFREDPLRVLRVARFAARFHSLEFKVAPQTLELMRQLSNDDELEHLSAERVWQEFERALATTSASTFLATLDSCGALKQLLPEIARLDSAQWSQLDAPNLTQPEERFALLAYHLGCSQPQEHSQQNAQQNAQEQRNETKSLDQIVERLRLPKRYSEIAKDLIQWGPQLARYRQLKPAAKLQVIEGLKLQRSLQRFDHIAAPIALLFGQSPNATADSTVLAAAVRAVNSVSPKDLLSDGLKGPALGEELRRRQLVALEQL